MGGGLGQGKGVLAERIREGREGGKEEGEEGGKGGREGGRVGGREGREGGRKGRREEEGTFERSKSVCVQVIVGVMVCIHR